jgi:hypothetical protein
MLRANHLHLLARRISLNHTSNFASASNGVKRKRGRPPNPNTARLTQYEEGEGCDLAASLDHYSRLPPLPPTGDWLSHFSFAPHVVRDRVSIRDPVSAIRVAHSFMTSKKTLTGNPKILIEAFPGACSPILELRFSYTKIRTGCPL